jgi:hypothetical protein
MTFDISVCKVFFDGVTVTDMSDGDLQMMQFHVNIAEFRGHMPRILKYITRGYKWANKEILPELVTKYKTQECLLMTIKRAMKLQETKKEMTEGEVKSIERSLEFALLKTEKENLEKEFIEQKLEIVVLKKKLDTLKRFTEELMRQTAIAYSVATDTTEKSADILKLLK